MKSHMIFEFLFLAEDNVADRTGFSLLSGVGFLMGVTSALGIF